MSKESFSIQVADVSAFARSLGTALRERHALRPAPPGQVELLNLIARAQGQRNWQALRASLRPPGGARPPAPAATPLPLPPLGEHARKALGQFDDRGRLIRWPAKFSVQKLVLWVLWTRFDAKRPYAEGEVNAVLKAANLFSDHVTLRRELVNHRLLARKSDCSEYRKLPARPDDEVRALIAACRSRFRDA